MEKTIILWKHKVNKDVQNEMEIDGQFNEITDEVMLKLWEIDKQDYKHMEEIGVSNFDEYQEKVNEFFELIIGGHTND